MIAKQLGLAGRKVLILEAGEDCRRTSTTTWKVFDGNRKVPESPYQPDLFTGSKLTDPATVNAGRPTVLSLSGNDNPFGAWQDPKQAHPIQKGPLPFASTYERVDAGTTRHWLGTNLRFVPHDFEMKKQYNRFVDWPINYPILEPWYCAAEHEIGVSANVNQQDYLGITFEPNYAYPMPGIPESLVDQSVEKAMPTLKVDDYGLQNIDWTIAPRLRPAIRSRIKTGASAPATPIASRSARSRPNTTPALRSRCAAHRQRGCHIPVRRLASRRQRRRQDRRHRFHPLRPN